MQKTTRAGVDIAKSVFHVHGVGRHSEVASQAQAPSMAQGFVLSGET
jgi:hypothetical protein